VSTARTIGGWTPGLRRLVEGCVLPCGCLTGIYETSSNDMVAIIDGRAERCRIASHVAHRIL
jgi:hypothetical protein